MVNRFSRNNSFSIFSIKDGNWHSPNTLSRNTPIFTINKHVTHARFSPFWHPIYLLNLFNNFFSKIFNRCKPLRSSSRSEERRVGKECRYERSRTQERLRI